MESAAAELDHALGTLPAQNFNRTTEMYEPIEPGRAMAGISLTYALRAGIESKRRGGRFWEGFGRGMLLGTLDAISWRMIGVNPGNRSVHLAANVLHSVANSGQRNILQGKPWASEIEVRIGLPNIRFRRGEAPTIVASVEDLALLGIATAARGDRYRAGDYSLSDSFFTGTNVFRNHVPLEGVAGTNLSNSPVVWVWEDGYDPDRTLAHEVIHSWQGDFIHTNFFSTLAPESKDAPQWKKRCFAPAEKRFGDDLPFRFAIRIDLTRVAAVAASGALTSVNGYTQWIEGTAYGMTNKER